MKVYLAAPLFTEAERAFNFELAEALEKEGHQVYLPQRDAPPASGFGRTTALFQANLAAVQQADCVVRSSLKIHGAHDTRSTIHENS